MYCNIIREVLQKYLTPSLTLLFQRLQSSKTPKFEQHFVRAMAHIIHRRGLQAMLAAMDGIQAGIFAMILDRVWLPNVGKGICNISIQPLLSHLE
jgi:exportin-2 (importin alpha re-exporter)